MLPGKKYGLQDYVALAKRYWWIVAITTAIGAFAALIVSATEKDSYQSDMLVQIVPQTIPESIIQPTVTSRTEDRMGSLEAQVKSRSQLERLIKEFDLYPELRDKVPMEDVVNKMRTGIKVDLIRQPRRFEMAADSFYVRFTYGDPNIAAKVTSSLGNLFIARNAEERGKLAGTANQFLVAQLVEAKAKLEEQEGKIERFRQQNAGRLPTQADFNMQAIQTTQTQLQGMIEAAARDRDRRTFLERLYNAALDEPQPVSSVPQPSPSATDPAPSTVPLQQQLVAARATLERLEARLKPEHPDLRRQRRLVADLEKRAAAESAATGVSPNRTAPVTVTAEELQRRERLRTQKGEIDSLESQIQFKEAEERRLRATIADYQARLLAIPGVQSEWTALTRDYETLRGSYENYLRKSEDSKVAADLERRQVGEQFKIVDSARVPVRPIGPIRLQINAIGTGAGLALGVAIIAVLFFRDTTFNSEADVLDVLTLPVLALVPYVTDAAELRRRRQRKLLLASVLSVAFFSGTYVTWVMQLWRYVA